MSKKPPQISYAEIDRSIRRLKDIDPKNTFLPESFADNMEQFVRIYEAIKPLLVAATTFPLIPAMWRRGLDLFKQFLDAIAAAVSAGNVTVNFKAGKDL